MCKFASIVLTKDKCFSLPDSESHSDIICHFKIHESGAHGLNVVKVEVLPPDNGILNPDDLTGWTVTFDQDQFPEWHDADRSASRALRALKSKLVNLTWLDARNSKIADVSKLVNLTTLDASYSNITDVSKLVNFTWLDASYSKIADVSKLVNLTTLVAYNSKIVDVSKLVNLTTLDASDSKIVDVSKLVNLTTLDAGYSNIADVSKLVNLTTLDASDEVKRTWKQK